MLKHKVTANAENSPAELLAKIEYLSGKLDAVLGVIENRLIRTPSERLACIDKELNNLKILGNFEDCNMYLLNKFTPDFFIYEIDLDYKLAVTKSIVEYMNNNYPQWKNTIIEGVARLDKKFVQYFTSIV